MRTTNLNFIAVMLAIFSMTLFSCSSGDGGTADKPKDVADKFLKAMGEGDMETAKSHATDAGVQALDMMASMGDSWEGTSYELGEVSKSEDGNSATVTYTMDGNEQTLDLAKKDGKWKVDYEIPMPGAEEEVPTDEGTEEGSPAEDAEAEKPEENSGKIERRREDKLKESEKKDEQPAEPQPQKQQMERN